MTLKSISLFLPLLLVMNCSVSQTKPKLVEYNEIICGADKFGDYLQFLKNKKVAIVANQATLVGKTHLVDTLLSQDVEISLIFCPEHGFRGTADAGAKVGNDVDGITGIPIISLYGSHRKPTSADLAGIDVVLFDLQDVGTRFYTYISTMTYVMEACAENNVPIIILDRPNPNGYFVDGPVMEEKYSSFVGLHPVPIVYGMTIGEYASMVVGEKWINKSDNLDIKIVPLSDYTHNLIVKLPVSPSPNLPNWQSVYLYPSLCLFEGTIMSVGRGTDVPFQIYGHPRFIIGSYAFKPQSRNGATIPKYKDEQCAGFSLGSYADSFAINQNQICLSWLMGSYDFFSRIGKDHDFFNNYFVKLVGTDIMQKQIEEGRSEEEIRMSWKPKLEKFLIIREKYLLYK